MSCCVELSINFEDSPSYFRDDVAECLGQWFDIPMWRVGVIRAIEEVDELLAVRR